ncbi:response regulator transcription factor [Salipaludibacillus daqingensis]|uniref:response regulator transcription factor n=1 Tax=Salipaludibacillus daqingensis TaxID=3041001 RepID=UPI0024761E6D|nr:response regulator [Salipaludibacillus daqingensis]
MTKKNILIVDDEPRSRLGVKRTLESTPSLFIDIQTAANAKEAQHVITASHIDLLITDIRMPEKTGLELIQSLKQNNPHLVFIVISAYSEFDYAHQALELGVINYLLKPVQKEKLIQAVEQALNIIEEQTRYGKVNRAIDQTLQKAESDTSDYSEAAQQVMNYVDDHLHEKITIKDAANAVHLNASYLSVHFKEQVGMTFSDYVTRKKLQYAKHLLLSTNETIAHIAEKTGYQTAKYFVKIFKSNVQMTPSEYRKNGQSSLIE